MDFFESPNQELARIVRDSGLTRTSFAKALGIATNTLHAYMAPASNKKFRRVDKAIIEKAKTIAKGKSPNPTSWDPFAHLGDTNGEFRALVKDSGLTHEEVAEGLGISLSSVNRYLMPTDSKWFTPCRPHTVQNLKHLVRALQQTKADLEEESRKLELKIRERKRHTLSSIRKAQADGREYTPYAKASFH